MREWVPAVMRDRRTDEWSVVAKDTSNGQGGVIEKWSTDERERAPKGSKQLRAALLACTAWCEGRNELEREVKTKRKEMERELVAIRGEGVRFLVLEKG